MQNGQREGKTMTNVPTDIREMWSDIYKLFDINYLMPNTGDAWLNFWEQAKRLEQKHKSIPRFTEMVVIVSEMIEDRMKAVRKDG